MTLANFRLGALVACAALAACGGGASVPIGPHSIGPEVSPAPSITPSGSPTTAANYSARIVWTGGLNTPTPVNALAKRRLDGSTATPAPLLVAMEPQLAPNAQQTPTGVLDAVASVVISPAPSAEPTIGWTDPSQNVSLAAQPSSGPTDPPGTIVVLPEQLGASTLTATVASPVSTTVTQPVFTISAFQLTCLAFGAYEPQPFGLYFNADGSYGFTSSPTGADIYLTGPQEPQGSPYGGCTSVFQTPAGSNYLLNAPAGIVDLGPNQDFPSIATSEFIAPQPSIVYAAPGTNSALSNDAFLFKTALGAFVKIQLAGGTGSTATGAFSGVYEAGSPSGGFPF